jgi:uncharacterized protein (DUF1800 family)
VALAAGRVLPTLPFGAGLVAAGTATNTAAATRDAASAFTAADAEALRLLDRLAFGPAPGDLARVRTQGTAAWLDEQLAPERLPLPRPLVEALAALPTLHQSTHDSVAQYRELERLGRQQAQARESADATMTTGPAVARESHAAPKGTADAQAPEEATPALRERRQLVSTIHVEAGTARLLRALHSPRQLEEVMVDFWFNHFNVYDQKALDRVLVGAYEQEAIRPHALGRFRDLLGATARHPAMLFYLDNWLSVGPDWRPPANARGLTGGQRAASGLNENYARELMELHTLGVEGGYTQADVTQLARMLTGWTFDTRPRVATLAFVFDPRKHDNGTKTWLGHTIEPDGEGEGEHALDVLASHPATARHIAFKLGQRFVADAPPSALVDAVARRFLDSGGDIRATLRALFTHPEFHASAVRGSQFKTPYEFIISAVRATGIPAVNMRPLLGALAQLGQPLYGCPTPDGWAHTQAAWLNPDAIARRIAFATALATGRMPLVDLTANSNAAVARAADAALQSAASAPGGAEIASSTGPVDARALLDTLGPTLTPATRSTIEKGPPALHAAMVLGSPDFMRR